MRSILMGLGAAALALSLLTGCSGGPDSEAESGLGSASTSASSGSIASAEASAPSEGQATEEAAAPSSAEAPSSASAEVEPAPTDKAPDASAAKPTPPPSAGKPPENEPPSPSAEAKHTVTVAVVGNDEWGTIVAAEAVDLKDGDTAVSVLKRVAKAHRLSFEIRGSGEFAYVEGIDGLYEFDDGPTSGWKFRVNGAVPDVGSGIYELKRDDKLEWFYTSEDEAAKEGKESP